MAPNIVLAPNMTQNANTGRKTQTLLISSLQMPRVPTRTGKPGKMGRHFPVREKSGNFEQTGKVRENHTKYWKILEFEINII